jgi:hypothetical protein
MTRNSENRFQQAFGDIVVGIAETYNEQRFKHYRFANPGNYTSGRLSEMEINMAHHDWTTLSYTFSANWTTSAVQVYSASQAWSPIANPLPTWTPADWGDNSDLTANGGEATRTYIGGAAEDDLEYTFPFSSTFTYDTFTNTTEGMVIDWRRRNAATSGDYSLDGNSLAFQPGVFIGGIQAHGTNECFRFGFNDETEGMAELRTYASGAGVPAGLSGEIALFIRSKNVTPTALDGDLMDMGLNIALAVLPTSGVGVGGGPWANSCQLLWLDPFAMFILSVPVDIGGTAIFDPVVGGAHLTYNAAFLGVTTRGQGSFKDALSVVTPGDKFLAQPGTGTVSPPPTAYKVARMYSGVTDTEIAYSGGGTALLFFNVTYNLLFQ